ncbi:uncharacterized protein IL334_003894 [Kwoniella shivajii]|uniref:Uncharacterized protein n=1 Tax=Kwoniella shivajii TaxID=564305 RepID=A0ABZ1D058_9TREE|nr:hypothetical protein IL334_003894 [Kwoniella shivajii]
MLGYYALSSRRKSSSHKDGSNPPSPNLPLRSTTNRSGSPISPASPSSPSKKTSTDNLGSPFSITNPIYPYQPNNHHTRQGSAYGLSENDHDMMTSGGSRSLLVARDFGLPGSAKQIDESTRKGKGKSKFAREYPMGNDEEQKELSNISSESFNLLPGDDDSLPKSPIDLPAKRRESLPHTHLNANSKSRINAFDDPSLIPPSSIHDKYVSKHILPITTASSPTSENTRPTFARSSSAPGQHSTALLPSAIPSSTSTAGEKKEESNQPIFEIFNANLSTSGLDMSKKLRGYLEIVLKGQDEVGKMHLNLEGLGMGERNIWEVDTHKTEPKDGKDVKSQVEEREKGIEEIMKRLDTISDTLRNYHKLGTPKLTFPRHQTHAQIPTQTSASHPSDSQEDPRTPTTPSSGLGRSATVANPSSPENTSHRQRAPTMVRSNTVTGDLSPISIIKDRPTPISPLVNTIRPSPDDEDVRKGSDLPPERLDDVPSPSPPYQGGKRVPLNLDIDEASSLGFAGHMHDHDHLNHRHHWFGESPENKSGKRERKITDSPVEMNFKARW